MPLYLNIKMNTQKRGFRRIEVAFFQIIVLMLGIVAFSYLVSGDAGIDTSYWSGICTSIAGSKSGDLSLDSINKLPLSAGSTLSIADGLLKANQGKLTEQSIVENCKNNPAALAKLNDKTLITGVDSSFLYETNIKNPAIFNDKSSKVFDEITKRMSDPKTSGDFLKEINGPNGNGARAGLIEKIGGGSGNQIVFADKAQIPTITSYDKNNNILSFKSQNNLESSLDLNSLKTGKIQTTVLENGDLQLSNGVKISNPTETVPANSRVAYNNGLKINAMGSKIDLSDVKFPKPGVGDIGVDCTHGSGTEIVRGTEKFEGSFQSTFGDRPFSTGKDQYSYAKFEKITEMDSPMGHFSSQTTDGTQTADGTMTLREGSAETTRLVEFTNGKLGEIEANKAIYVPDGDSQLLMQKFGIKPDDSVVIGMNNNIGDVQVYGKGQATLSGGHFLSPDAPFSISTENAAKDGSFTILDSDNHKIIFTSNGVVDKESKLANLLGETGKVEFSHLSTNGKNMVTDSFSTKDGELVTATTKGAVTKNTGLGALDKLKSGWDKAVNGDSLKGALPMIALLAAVGGVAYFLLKGKDDKSSSSSKTASKNGTSTTKK